MEGEVSGAKESAAGIDATRRVESPPESIADSVLTEDALSELKRQAPAGCVLCWLDAWDEEEWD